MAEAVIKIALNATSKTIYFENLTFCNENAENGNVENQARNNKNHKEKRLPKTPKLQIT